MKLSCQIIEDLLPLYEDNVCSAQSRAAVEEHLQSCEKCKQLYEGVKTIPVPETAPEATDKAVQKSFQKIRRRWAASLLVLILLVPVCLLGFNQLRGLGCSFTNIHELMIGHAFMEKLKDGDYEGAYRYIDIKSKKSYFLEEWFDEEALENIEADGLREFCEAAEMLIGVGGITEYRFTGISWQPTFYDLNYSVVVGGETRRFHMAVSDDGVQYFGGNGNMFTDPLAHIGMWSEYLWQSYAGCYFDQETKQYVYYE